VAGGCLFPAKNCTSDLCHAASCNSSFPGGCVFTLISNDTCDDGDACSVDSCDPSIGCVHVNISSTCDDGLLCTTDSCSAQFGCVSTFISCPDLPPCSFGTCVNGTCSYFTPEVCKEDVTTIAVATALSVGAIIGIVIAVLACLGLIGGAAYAGRRYYNAKKDLDAYGVSNPLYEKGEVGGASPIYEAAERTSVTKSKGSTSEVDLAKTGATEDESAGSDGAAEDEEVDNEDASD